MSKQTALSPPPEFYKLVNDFVNDMSNTFPEYTGIISRWWNRPLPGLSTIEFEKQRETLLVFRHCKKVYPERFFDILYKNVNIFSDDSEVNTEFLPGIVFKQLWNLEDISDLTKETIWKYLQLILLSVFSTVEDSGQLGDTAKLFEAIDEEELKRKMEETIQNMQEFFSNHPQQDISLNNLPNAEKLHEHIEAMMGGKLGKLAMEIAEETVQEFDLDGLDDATDAKDIFQKLFKNPGKMMNMVKNIGNKLDDKIKSGEIKESEIMSEGMDLFNKMKDMPGMGDWQKIISQMGLGGGKGKVDINGMAAQMNRNMKNAQLKERLRQRVQKNEQEKREAEQPNIPQVFSTGEKVDKTPRKKNKKVKKGKK
jgi:hypothetical protein